MPKLLPAGMNGYIIFIILPQFRVYVDLTPDDDLLHQNDDDIPSSSVSML